MSGSTYRRNARPTGLLASVVALLSVIGLLLPALAGSAAAQDVDGARAEADALEAKLSSARDRLIELAEEFNRAGADLESAKSQVADNAALLEQNQAALADSKDQLRDYALAAYVSGGSLREVDGLLGGEADTADRRLNYLKTAAGNEKQIRDDLARAKQDVSRQLERLREAEAAAEAEQQRIDDARNEATQLEATTADLLDQANGRLAELVAEAEAQRAEQERLAAADAARAAGAERELAVATAATATAPTSAIPAAAPTQVAPSYTPPPGLRPEAAIALSAAMSQLGVPYVFGGASPSQGFDCSGLMYWAYAQAGIRISRPADYQRDDSIRISYEDLQPGDLVFYGEPVSHDAMYIGNDMIINAPQTGDVVSIKTMWYSSKPMSYGRIA